MRSHAIPGKLRSLTLFLTICALSALGLAACGDTDSGSGGTSGTVGTWDSAPVVLTPETPNTAVLQSDKAILDYSNAALGYICAKSLSTAVVKLLVDVAGAQYQYTLSTDKFDVIPLSCGNGTYSFGVWENVFQDQYAAVFSKELQIDLSDPFLPFLYPNQYVNFSADNQAISLSSELATPANDEVGVIGNVYNYVTKNIDYDYDKAATVQANYLPVVDQTLAEKKGICFDYAVLMASMLRAQRIPAKLVVGYAETAYHAWLEVYSQEEGWVRKEVHFDGTNWSLMDPTFAAAGSAGVALVGDGSHYSPIFYY